VIPKQESIIMPGRSIPLQWWTISQMIASARGTMHDQSKRFRFIISRPLFRVQIEWP
jgi:hypothetical protein